MAIDQAAALKGKRGSELQSRDVVRAETKLSQKLALGPRQGAAGQTPRGDHHARACIASGDVFSACGRLDATSGSPFKNTVDSEWFAYASKMYSIQ